MCIRDRCLTVCEIFQNEFVADVMMETVRATNLSTLTRNSKVNLERAMSLSSRFGGHIVTGHVDTTGTIVDFKKEENAVWISIKADEDFLDYVVYKGSITIDGVSPVSYTHLNRVYGCMCIYDRYR